MSFVLRAGFEGSGSPRWLMRTLQRHGLDRARGFRLELRLLKESTRRHGTLQAIADGEADVVDGDWLALAEARAAGLPVTAVMPYGQILGSVMLGRGVRGKTLAVLRGRKLGVLSSHDKNWAILRAACARSGFVLEDAARIEYFASRATLDIALDSGAVDAALVHWHRVPELVAAGHRLLAEIPDLADPLRQGALATTFFVVHDDLARQWPGQVVAFIEATRAAIALMRNDPAPWQALAQEEGSGLPLAAPLQALRQRWNRRVADIAPWGPASRESLYALRRQLLKNDEGLPDQGLPQFPRGAFDLGFLP
ncbi:MAG TPA: ABC transporter substrate-binding protein [Rhodocyclaceae bacterium]